MWKRNKVASRSSLLYMVMVFKIIESPRWGDLPDAIGVGMVYRGTPL